MGSGRRPSAFPVVYRCFDSQGRLALPRWISTDALRAKPAETGSRVPKMQPATTRPKTAGLNLACGEARPLKRPEHLERREYVKRLEYAGRPELRGIAAGSTSRRCPQLGVGGLSVAARDCAGSGLFAGRGIVHSTGSLRVDLEDPA